MQYMLHFGESKEMTPWVCFNLFHLPLPLHSSLLSHWRTVPVLYRWSRATAAPHLSTPLTTHSSPPPHPSTRWTSANLAFSREGSESKASCLVSFLINKIRSRRVFVWNIAFVHHGRALQLSWTVVMSVFCLSYVLLELVETERDYVRDLGSVVEVKK